MPERGGEPAPRILVVDDEPHVLEAVRALLTGHGFSVLAAENGTVAIELATAELPDVVLLDLVMPGLNGVATCQQLRTLTTAPILVLSALTDEPEKVRALDAGADDYVTKPFGGAELLARVRAAVRRARLGRSSTGLVQAGDLTVDLQTRIVRRNGDEIRLTPTEFALLREMALNPDRVLTQRHLLTAVFGPGYENATANLRLFVAQLRRKIEPDPTRPKLITTEPGVGYRFRPTA
jgi:two-component system, OmpR family, KDP operon response regulator KdpE